MCLEPSPCKPEAEACDGCLVRAMPMEESRHCCAQDGLTPSQTHPALYWKHKSQCGEATNPQIYIFYFFFPLKQPGMRPKM